MIELRRLLGMPADEPIVVDTASSTPEVLPGVEETLATVLERRADLLALEHQARVAEAESQLAKSLRTPNLNLGADLAKEGEEDRAGLSVGAAIPLFNRNEAEVKAAEARRRRADLARTALRLEIESDLLAAAERYRAAREAVEIYQVEVLPLFEENITLLNEAFKTGKVSFLQVIAVRREFVEQRKIYLESLQQAQEAFINWQSAGGFILPVDAPVEPAPTGEPGTPTSSPDPDRPPPIPQEN